MKIKHGIFASVAVLCTCLISIYAAPGDDVDFLVGWLLEDSQRLNSVSFSSVVKASSGHSILPIDQNSEVDSELLDAIGHVVDSCIEELNTSGHSIHQIGRINEVSRPIEDYLLHALDAMDDLSCSIPLNASGEHQRSGYPDLRIEHIESGRVFYLDPKVYRSGSERSGFRTFYFEPKLETNKILDNASHLILGIAHSGKVDGRWQFDRWQLVDLIDFKVRLKAEFQSSNRELYRDNAVLRSGARKKAASKVEAAE
ncbi:MAG: hypothetical protein ACPGJU_07130 [Coraliomargarita sp.]